MTIPVPDDETVPTPGEVPDPVKATAPVAEPAPEERDDDEAGLVLPQPTAGGALGGGNPAPAVLPPRP